MLYMRENCSGLISLLEILAAVGWHRNLYLFLFGVTIQSFLIDIFAAIWRRLASSRRP
jgi:hypothetical protein